MFLHHQMPLLCYYYEPQELNYKIAWKKHCLQPQNVPGKSIEKVGLRRFLRIPEGRGFVLKKADWWKTFAAFIPVLDASFCVSLT